MKAGNLLIRFMRIMRKYEANLLVEMISVLDSSSFFIYLKILTLIFFRDIFQFFSRLFADLAVFCFPV